MRNVKLLSETKYNGARIYMTLVGHLDRVISASLIDKLTGCNYCTKMVVF